MRKLITLIFLLLAITIFATHNRAGEITYRHLGGFSYEVTVTTYTKIGGNEADRLELEVSWGDGSSDILPRTSLINFGAYRHNTYIGNHTYTGIGVYEIVMEDPNRNSNIQNIPESVNIVFTIKTQLRISAILGNNNTPVLLNKPLDKAAVGQIFIHNPGAYDPDGDSLSYKLTTCLGYNGEPIPNYTLPQAANSISINEYTGDFVWDYPMHVGEYNVAIIIEEWRNGIKIGQVLRDMQIDVRETTNTPPTINNINDTCIMAGQPIQFDVVATDNNDYSITLFASGINKENIIESGNPSFGNAETSAGYAKKTFYWIPFCNNISKNPYTVVFKAEDNNNAVNLVDIQSVRITVVAPPPTIDTLIPTNNSININWHSSTCDDVKGFEIYRKTQYYGFVPSYCETGVPAYTGYQKIATINNKYATTYLDNNNGLGLTQGYIYCYMVVAFYENGAESYASNEVCTDLVQGIPIITNVSVLETAIDTGQIYLAWSSPKEFDTTQAPGPYKYLIYRSNDFWGQNLILIDSLSSINDTIYIDKNLNTKDNPYSYKVEFYNNQIGNRFLIGAPNIASSVYLKLIAQDNKIKLKSEQNVPWFNNEYNVYKKNGNTFNILTTVQNNEYTDGNLANGTEYCYYIKTKGFYQTQNVINPIINLSQITCTEPIDTFPSCPPTLKLTSNCDSIYNFLQWTNPNRTCSDDVLKYNIYYSPTYEGKLNLIKTINNPNDTTFKHIPTTSIAGCYSVSAIDSCNNESNLSVKTCIDICEYYELPNIFTPNGDGINDLFRPGPYKFVHKIDIKIFNRWGNVIFETENPDILWDGTVNGKKVSNGIYYYICDVYEYRLTGIEPRNLSGFVHLERGKETNNND